MTSSRCVRLLVVLVAVAAGPAGAQTTTTIATTTTLATTTTTTLPVIPPSTLCTCTNNQCLVTGNHTLNPGSIDFGTCALVLDTGVTVTLSSPGTLQIAAGSLALNAQASIVAAGGSIVVNVPGTIALAIRSSLDVSAPDATFASISLTAGGAVTLGGRLNAQATGTTGSGGSIDVTAGGPTTPGDIGVNDRIRARGGGQGSGGSVCLTARNGGITVNASIDASGGEFDGGSIDLEADGSIMVTGGASGVTLDVSGGGLSGFGGLVVLNSNVTGDVTVNAPVLGPGAGSLAEGGGDGGEFDASTVVGNVTVNATVDVRGGQDGGGGGTVDLEPADDLTVTGQLLVSGLGAGTIGGDVIFINSGATLLSSLIDVSATGSQSSAGTVSLNVPGVTGTTAALLAGSEINGDSAPGTTAGGGGFIQLVDETLTVDGFLHADGGGGEVNLQACTVTVHASGQIRADQPGTNLLQASGQMTIGGMLVSGPQGTNRLEYRDPSNPPNVTGASITPAPTIALNPALPPCSATAMCGDGIVQPPEQCDDGNTTPCDGCTNCKLDRCGDGVTCPNEGEQCDDGAANGTSGDPCDASCHLVGNERFVPGAHAGRTGCFLEWGIQNAKSPVKGGVPSRRQTCIDGDPQCDSDGANDGVCTFAVRACVAKNDARLPLCQPTAVMDVNLRRPSPVSPQDMVEAANASTLVNALEGLGLTVRSGATVLQPGTPDPRRDDCTGSLAIRVPHPPGLSGHSVLAIGSHDTSDHSMRDNRVVLVCANNPAVCGNGIVDLGEQCDDGAANGTRNSCCSVTCHFQPAQTACADDSNLCTDDVCDATGTCTHALGPATTCVPAGPHGASLKITNHAQGAPDTAQFKWGKGPAVTLGDFGAPGGGTFYELCIYDEAAGVPSNVYRGQPGGPCGATPCWTSGPTGWKFTSKAGAPDGITGVKLQAGAAGKAKVQMSAGKLDLSLGAFPLQVSPRVVAQVRTSSGQCWGANFSIAITNTPALFKAKSD